MESRASLPLQGRSRILIAICGAAAAAGLAEVFLGRVAAPGLSFGPNHQATGNLGLAAEAIGERAAAAGAVLVLVAALWFVVTRVHQTVVVATAVVLGVGSGFALVMLDGTVGYFGLLAALTVLLACAVKKAQWAAGLAVLALFARHAPLAADAITSPLSASQLSLVTTIGEAALLLVAPALVISLLRHEQPSKSEWGVAVLGAAFATAVLMAAPTRMPMIAFGSLDLAMSMPVPLYALSAGALALVVTRDTRHRGSPTHSIALAMLFVAAVQPSVLHHIVAGLIAVALLVDTEIGAPHIVTAEGTRSRHSCLERSALAAVAETG